MDYRRAGKPDRDWAAQEPQIPPIPSSATKGAQDLNVRAVTAAIVHEVNQPLAAALISAEAALRWLEQDPPNLNRAKLAIEHLIGNSLRVTNATSSVRDLLQDEPLQISDVSINDIIDNIAKLHQSDLLRKRVAIECDLAEHIPLVEGDQIQLERLIANLITNAADAICAAERRDRVLRIISKPHDDGDGILVEVADTGTGIDTAMLERLFQPFFTTKPHGMGLGLWLCRTIVERHGGRLWAERDEPYGSIFKFTLPSLQSG